MVVDKFPTQSHVLVLGCRRPFQRLTSVLLVESQ